MRRGLRSRTGLTDGAVFPAEAGTSAVALILFLSIPYTHTLVLTGEITAWVHCGEREERMRNTCDIVSSNFLQSHFVPSKKHLSEHKIGSPLVPGRDNIRRKKHFKHGYYPLFPVFMLQLSKLTSCWM